VTTPFDYSGSLLLVLASGTGLEDEYLGGQQDSELIGDEDSRGSLLFWSYLHMRHHIMQ
jgi:hypothetical protein